MSRLDASPFVALVGPLFARGRQDLVPRAVARRWPLRDVLGMLAADPTGESGQLAAATAALIAQPDDSALIAPLLAGPSDAAAELAEHVLWQVWMRAGSAAAVHRLARGIQRLEQGNPREALALLEPVRNQEPRFAEPHHQAGLAHQLLAEGEAAEAACQTCCRLNPWHYAARATLGHLCIERDAFGLAAEHYAQSLALHPRQPELAAAHARLREALARRIVA